MSGNQGAKGATVLSLRDILKEAVKSRIAGGNAVSVKIPVATQSAENGRACVQISKLTWIQNYPGVGATYLHMQVQRAAQKITVLGLNDNAGVWWAWPEP